MYVERNAVARWRNNCCRGKGITITHYECLYSAFFIRHANRIFSATCYIVICGLSGFTIFFAHYLINGTIFGKQLLNIKYVL